MNIHFEIEGGCFNESLRVNQEISKLVKKQELDFSSALLPHVTFFLTEFNDDQATREQIKTKFFSFFFFAWVFDTILC